MINKHERGAVMEKSENSEVLIVDKEKVLMRDKILIETTFDISAVENRMFYYILYKIQMGREKKSTCFVTKEEFFRLMANKNARKVENILAFLDKLQKVDLIFWKNSIKGKYCLIAGYEYDEKNPDEFKVTVPEVVFEKLTKFDRNRDVYAPLNLSILGSLRGFYSQRLYEIVRLWSRTDKEITHDFTIEYIRFILGIPDEKYTKFKNLNIVLRRAVKELNDKANINISYEPVKKSGKAIAVRFVIKDWEQKNYFGGGSKVISEPNYFIPEEIKLTKESERNLKKDFPAVDFNDEFYKNILIDGYKEVCKKLNCVRIGKNQYGAFCARIQERIMFWENNCSSW